ncbi:type I polyketide synthase [Allonocardiopsis opalescens]|uniref:Acyl transferase domain-containing protein n=1 Tax=Allonocardiopsis opalescens TaxID=1144618 RepID=A0A2T0PYT1_9ACTN|nr:type I polyketide synthase [Allonocardiopsis opalescens]PRX96690.1 acyl transferase domain-containing protein [Allonocardiopsis opalescens]
MGRWPDFGPNAIAVVGAACRLPGGIVDLSGLWSALAEGRDLITPPPPGRFDEARYLSDDRARPGRTYSFTGGYLDDLAGWDAGYFGVSPREASRIDPQQRIMLDLAAEALDDAGMDPAALAGSDTGVYIGVYQYGYGALQQHNPDTLDAHTVCGTAGTSVPNRVSYHFDLRGPSTTVDTACSSSLIAVHQACESLVHRRSRMAIAGGVNVLINPYEFVLAAKGQVLSRRGRCQTFSAGADGYVRSEGGGLVLLKLLDDALAEGDRVHAVIMATGTNCDGRTEGGLSRPSAAGQAALLREVYARAGVAPDELAYFEAHGTGTPTGDPVECEAVGRALGVARTEGPLPIGSVKTNLGHLEGAAGITGLLKSVLVVRERCVPPLLHADTLNPAIDFAGLGLDPVRTARRLEPGRRAVVGVNSFGIGGANAHVVLAEPPPAERAEPRSRRRLPVLVSARTGEAAARAAADMADRLAAAPTEDFYDLSYTSCRRRGGHEHRAAVLAATPAEAAGRLRALAAAPGRAVRTATAARGVAFVFSGNGSQWAGMGAALLEADPVFRAAVAEADAVLRPELGWSVLDELTAPPERSGLARTEVAQPALFALQVGLVAALAERGVRPAAATGHSVGEVAAAHAAGAYDLATAARVIAARSRAQGRTAGTGRMAAVGLSVARAEKELAAFAGRLEIAAVNSDTDVTVSGDPAALAELGERLRLQEAPFRALDLDYGFHSRAMDPIEAQVMADLAGLGSAEPRIPLVSTVTGSPVAGDELDAGYWWRNVREPVLFAAAVRRLAREGCGVFVEIGPHPVLGGYLRRLTAGAERHGAVVATLTRPERAPEGGEAAALDAAAADVIACGAEVDWEALLPDRGRVVDLPRYPWRREPHWNGDPNWWAPRAEHPALEHALLGERAPVMEPTWTNRLEPALLPWLADHKVRDAVVMPLMGYAEMALAAGRRALGAPVEVAGLEVLSLLALAWDDPEMDVRTQVSVGADGVLRVAGRTGTAGDWRVHARARVRERPERRPADLDPAALRARLDGGRWEAERVYALMRGLGIQHGPAFRIVREVHVGTGEGLARYRCEHPADGFEAHPVVLDGALHTTAALLAGFSSGQLFLPAGVDALRAWRRPAADGLVHLRVVGMSGDEAVLDLLIADEDGTAAVEIEGYRLRRVEDGAAAERRYTTVRRAVPRPGPAEVPVLSPSPAELVASAADRLAAAHRLVRTPRAVAARRALMEAGGHFAAGALAEFAAAGAVFTAADLVARGVLPKYARYLDVLAHCASRQGLVDALGTPEAPRWRVCGRPTPVESFRRALADFPELDGALLLLGRCGRHLAAALRGEHDPMDLVVLGQTRLLEHVYRELHATRKMNEEAAALLAAIAAHRPADRPLRVLEVGAGTGSLTAALLPVLPPERTRYVFTDLTPYFVDPAKKQFARYDFVDYRLLDLEKDPAEQGFAPGGFDVVVAANSVHATTDVRATLRRLAGLLDEGGHLLCVELHELDSIGMSFGLLDGFWNYSDTELRGPLPLLPRDRWLDVIADAGFADVVPASTDPEDEISVLLARRGPVDPAAGRPAPDAAEARPASWIVAAEPGAEGLADALGARLAEPGGAVVRTGADGLVPAWTEHTEASGLVIVLGDGPDGRTADTVEDAVRRIAVLRSVAAAAERSPAGALPALWLVTRPSGFPPGAEPPFALGHAAAWGACRVLANENPGMAVRKVALRPGGDAERDAALLARELLDPDGEDEIILDGGRFAPRETAVPPAAEPAPAVLRLRRPGPHHRLDWTERAAVEPGPGQVAIEVRAVGLTRRDAMEASGAVRPASPLESGYTVGTDCAGVVVAVGERVTGFARGDRVFALAPGAAASHVAADAGLVGTIPAEMPFAAAAVLPTALLTVEYALRHTARPRPGETLLLLGGAGPTELAALRHARGAGARVIAVGASALARDLLALSGADHVLDPEPDELARRIAALTGGGVDIVLDTSGTADPHLAGELLRPGGRFVAAGPARPAGGAPSPSVLGSAAAVDVHAMIVERPDLARACFADAIASVRSGHAVPAPYTAHPAEDLAAAYRALADPGGTGGTVIALDRAPAAARPAARIRLDADAVYLVTGGLGGFGAATARRLAERGARRLALVGRRGAGAPEAPALLAELRASGAEATAHAVDVTDEAALRALLEELTGPGRRLGGVVHAAMVLADAPLTETSDDDLRTVLAPKVRGAELLDRLTRGRELDFFVVYSSIATTVGSGNQAAYVAANAYLEALVRERRAAGLPGLAMGWGAIGDTGVVARGGMGAAMGRRGIGAIDSATALDELEAALARHAAVVAVAEMDWPRFASFSPNFHTQTRLAGFAPRTGGEAGTVPAAGLDELPPEECGRRVEDILVGVIARVMRTGADGVDRTRRLADLGIDSIMATELVLGIRAELGCELSPVEVGSSPSVADLAERVTARRRLAAVAVRTEAAP